MALRFHGRAARRSARDERATDPGLGDWWAAVVVVALATVATGFLGVHTSPVATSPPPHPAPDLLASISPAQRALANVESAFARLCREPMLLALELEPDCETGAITLPDDLFDTGDRPQLQDTTREPLNAAMRVYLQRLRDLPALWDSLDAIEIRGHADPRALRRPYSTNLVRSQQRATAVLLFLVGPRGLREADRIDLERLAVVSGVSFSRPPATCRADTPECWAQWRRVEIRPVLSEPLRRGDWSRTLEGVRITARRLQAEFPTPDR